MQQPVQQWARHVGCFNGGVQCQDIGLECDTVNDTDNVDNFLRRAIDRVHRTDDLVDHFAALSGNAGSSIGKFIGLLRIFRILFDGGGELLHGRGRLFQRTGLMLGARRQIHIARDNILRVGGNGIARHSDFGDDFGQIVAH